MTKNELIIAVSERSGIDRQVVERVLHATLNEVKEVVVRGKTIYIRGFGSIGVQHRKEKIIEILNSHSSEVKVKGEILKNAESEEWLWSGEFEVVANKILSLPLDVPSDEEIKKACSQSLSPRIAAWLQGARWVKEEIINRNTNYIGP